MTSISFKVSSSCFANAVGLGGASFSAGGASFSAGGALFSVGGASFSAGWASFSVGCMNGTMAPCCSRCFFRSASSSLSWGSPWRHKSYSYHTVSASSPPQPQSSELGCTDSVLGTSCGVGDFLPSTRLAGTSVSCFERSELALPRSRNCLARLPRLRWFFLAWTFWSARLDRGLARLPRLRWFFLAWTLCSARL